MNDPQPWSAQALLAAIDEHLEDEPVGWAFHSPLMNSHEEWAADCPIEDAFRLDRGLPGRGLKCTSNRAQWLWRIETDLPMEEWPVLEVSDDGIIEISHGNLAHYLSELATSDDLTWIARVTGLPAYDHERATAARDAARSRWNDRLPAYAEG